MLFFSTQAWFSQDFLKTNALPLFVNGIISSFLVIGLLALFEYLFNVLTNISLLELSDFNQPLLKKLILEAPGTYQHSLVAGSISEIAAESIGANALLARVGAYYHDIGKLEKPEYFSENQEINLSKHDKILPSISKLIIVNHVKDGIDLAKKYRLSPLIVEFISQHHGTSLTYYFYCRALEDMEKEGDVKEEGFRYPGPKPQTKEIAIVMLADSIEAATRTLEEPTPARIEEMVRKIINNKFIDGQLDECELTLKDLEKIASSFIRVLSAMYHSRIKYPAS
jgi:putative nucleotidyltransferase with HDIG domain